MHARDMVLRPRDPIIVRDGRPFAATPGAQAASLPWPLPGTVTGALRTRIGMDQGFDWKGDGPDRARRVAVHGPLMLARWPGDGDGEWRVYLAAPRDALVVRGEFPPVVRALRPRDTLPEGAGCDLPPGMLPLHIPSAEKPTPGHAYWPLDACVEWLADVTFGLRPLPRRTVDGAPRDARVHVRIDPSTRAGARGFLFGTIGLAFADAPRLGLGVSGATVAAPGSGAADVGAATGDGETADRPALAMLCRVVGSEVAAWSPPDTVFVTLGGERRLVEAHALASGTLWPTAPAPRLRAALVGARRLRMMLVTPALFTAGWRPGWLDDRLEGTPPGGAGPRLRLVAAAVGRKAPVSGWDLQHHRPKAARYTVPAGSVYFFETIDGPLDGTAVGALWMAALSDDAQDRADGFGLALPGVWSPHEGGV